MANQYWRRWLKEYAPYLVERRKWDWDVDNLREGDVVLIIDESSPREHWPMGKVVRSLPGLEDIVLAVLVKTNKFIKNCAGKNGTVLSIFLFLITHTKIEIQIPAWYHYDDQCRLRKLLSQIICDR